jgi:hypothetical protein
MWCTQFAGLAVVVEKSVHHVRSSACNPLAGIAVICLHSDYPSAQGSATIVREPTNTAERLHMKPRVNLRLDAGLLALLEDVAFEKKTTKTAVLEDALRHYFSDERDYALEDRVMLRLENFETRMGRLEWKANLNIEIMSHFIHYWLTRTDPIPESERGAAAALGFRRFTHFMDQVARKMKKRRTLSHESLRWQGAEPE